MSRRAAIVTGARRGIGRAIAEGLAADGLDVLLADLERDEAAEETLRAVAARDVTADFARCDIADLNDHEALIEAAVAAFGRIDVLVNNAGIAPPVRGDLIELAPENFDRVLAVNLRGTLFLTQTVARWMLANPDPGADRAIVTITSSSAELATPERTDYCVAKAGLSMAMKNFALRLAPHGIAVFEVRPGIIRTGMTAVVAEKYDRAIAEGVVPARRWGEPADVATVVAALASGRLGFSTGSVVNADGGLMIPRL